MDTPDDELRALMATPSKSTGALEPVEFERVDKLYDDLWDAQGTNPYITEEFHAEGNRLPNFIPSVEENELQKLIRELQASEAGKNQWDQWDQWDQCDKWDSSFESPAEYEGEMKKLKAKLLLAEAKNPKDPDLPQVEGPSSSSLFCICINLCLLSAILVLIQDNFETALPLFEAALKLEPTNYSLWNRLGTSLTQLVTAFDFYVANIVLYSGATLANSNQGAKART